MQKLKELITNRPSLPEMFKIEAERKLYHMEIGIYTKKLKTWEKIIT